MTPGLLSRLRRHAPVRAQTLGPGAWLLQRRTGGRRLRVRPIGRPEASTYLVHDPRATRRHMWPVQRQLGQWLLHEQALWMVRVLGVDSVLDVGANAGQYARQLRAGGYRGRIDSFEPVAEFADKLRAASAGDPDWHVHPYALGAEDTTAEINVTPGRTLSSLLPATEFGRSWRDALGHARKETIRVRRLDSVLDEVLAGLDEPRIFLKLDTQGYDLEVVRGAGDRMRQVLALQSELAMLPLYEGMPLFDDHLRTLRTAGFEVTGMGPVGRDRATLGVVEFDVVMARPDAISAVRSR